MRLYRIGAVAAGAVMAMAAVVAAQSIGDTEPRALEIEKTAAEAEEPEEQLFWLNSIPPLRHADRALDALDEISPLKFGAESQFVSDWLDEGANGAKHGLQILQTYFTEYSKEVGEFTLGAGFSYFQADTTGRHEGSKTLERDFTVYAPLTWKRLLTVAPFWNYLYYDEDPDSGEIGAEFTVDMPLNPSFAWNYDYRELKEELLRVGCSAGLPPSVEGETVAVLRRRWRWGSTCTRASRPNHLTHLDWGSISAFR